LYNLNYTNVDYTNKIMQFKNREKELDELNRILLKKDFQLIIIYGRRRIGKTELILRATREKKRIYYLAVSEKNLERFYKICANVEPKILNFKKDYEILLKFLKNKVDVIIFDEFQYIIQENPNILNLFQAIIDTELKDSNLKIFLIGSSISMMTSRIFSYSSPLYGRRTGSIKLKAIEFNDLKYFFPELNIKERIEIYGFADGIPHYLNFIKPPFWTWLSKELMSSSNIFKDEVDFLMRYEFKKPSMYKLILESIAFGNTKLSEIKNFIGLKRTDISPYLKNLMDIDMIIREIPITEKISSRRGRYYIKDNFLRFWFRFIYPNLSALEEGVFNAEIIKKEYPVYLGKIFEKVVKSFIIRTRLIEFTKIGRWWWKEFEIDLIAINELNDKITFIECKWQDNVNALKIVKQLAEKSKHVRWRDDDRNETFMIFARTFSRKISGFNNKKVTCFDLNDLEKNI